MKSIEKSVEYQKTFAEGSRDGVITEQPGGNLLDESGGGN